MLDNTLKYYLSSNPRSCVRISAGCHILLKYIYIYISVRLFLVWHFVIALWIYFSMIWGCRHLQPPYSHLCFRRGEIQFCQASYRISFFIITSLFHSCNSFSLARKFSCWQFCSLLVKDQKILYEKFNFVLFLVIFMTLTNKYIPNSWQICVF